MLHDKGMTKLSFSVIRSWGPIFTAKLGVWENLDFYFCSYTSILRYRWFPCLVNFSSKMVLPFKNEGKHLKISGYKPKCKRKLIFITLLKITKSNYVYQVTMQFTKNLNQLLFFPHSNFI